MSFAAVHAGVCSLSAGTNHLCAFAQGVVYTKSLQTGWKPKAKYRAMREEAHQDFRDKFHIICEGDNLPPPVRTAHSFDVHIVSASMCTCLFMTSTLHCVCPRCSDAVD